MPQAQGSTNEDGEWEQEFMECPLCGHILKARDLQPDVKV